MRNWTVDEKKMAKHKKEYAVWRLEQMVNFGLDGGKINGRELKKFWDKASFDPARRRFLEILLHGK